MRRRESKPVRRGARVLGWTRHARISGRLRHTWERIGPVLLTEWLPCVRLETAFSPVLPRPLAPHSRTVPRPVEIERVGKHFRFAHSPVPRLTQTQVRVMRARFLLWRDCLWRTRANLTPEQCARFIDWYIGGRPVPMLIPHAQAPEAAGDP